MSVVDEGAEFVGGAEAAGGGEEVGDVVTERPVVGVLGNSHHLHGVVAELGDAGEDEGTELFVGAHTFALGGDAEVGLVDARGGGLGGAFVFPLIGLRGMPDGARERVIFGILEGVTSEGGEA